MKWIRLKLASEVLRDLELPVRAIRHFFLLKNIVLACYFLTSPQVRSWNSGVRKNMWQGISRRGSAATNNLLKSFSTFSTAFESEKWNKSKRTWCSFKCLVGQRFLVRHEIRQNAPCGDVYCVFTLCYLVALYFGKEAAESHFLQGQREKTSIQVLFGFLRLFFLRGWQRWSVCQTATLFQIEITQQLHDGLSWIFVQTFIVLRGLIQLTLAIPSLFLYHHHHKV